MPCTMAIAVFYMIWYTYIYVNKLNANHLSLESNSKNHFTTTTKKQRRKGLTRAGEKVSRLISQTNSNELISGGKKYLPQESGKKRFWFATQAKFKLLFQMYENPIITLYLCLFPSFFLLSHFRQFSQLNYTLFHQNGSILQHPKITHQFNCTVLNIQWKLKYQMECNK